MQTMTLFVYGTLRPAEHNYRMLAPAVLDVVDDVPVSGSLYHVDGTPPGHRIYPVANFDEEGVVTGTLLVVEANHRGVSTVRRMEIGAGYEERRVVGDAIAFHYPYADVGARIASGNWYDVPDLSQFR